MVVCEERSLRLDATLASKNLLRREWCEFVSYRVTRLWILLGRVNDLEDAVVEGIGINTRGLVDGRLADLVEIAIGVGFLVPGSGVGFFIEDGVVVSVDCRVKTSGKDVLVVLGKHTS